MDMSTPCKIDDILSKLTLQEKVSLLSAKDWWRTPVIERADVFVPHIKVSHSLIAEEFFYPSTIQAAGPIDPFSRPQMTDGPNGARGESYVSGIRAACFPCSTALGATFDVNVLHEAGRQIAKEAKTKSAKVLLAPTVNVIRSPLGGRNYETYSEDPFVLGTLGAAYINGCQSEGIAATPKHFVANEAENRRRHLTVEVDEETLREIYLYPFQLIMKLSTPWCFMTSYNKVNGTYVAEDPRLVNEVLRKEWGFKGLVMSDWMGTYSTADGINAGNDLEMPGPTLWRGDKLLKAVEDRSVLESTIDTCSTRVLELADKLGSFEHPQEAPEREVEDEARDIIIRDAAADGMVLLKNDENVLPLHPDANVAVIGHLAKVVSLGGGGSAKVNALHAVTPLEGLDLLAVKYSFEPGVPVFAAVPHADPAIVSRADRSEPGTDSKPVKLEWFNSNEIGQNLAHHEMIPNAEYMIKEAWPSYLDEQYCTRMTFGITPATTGDHTLSVITTGTATVFVDGVEVYTRKQELTLVPESFYFFKSKIERRFTHPMNAGQRYLLTLEAWATDPKVLAKVNGRMFQGTALRFFEYVDIPASIARAASTAGAADVAVIFVGNTNEIESEGYDRDTMDLLPDQYSLISAVAAKNSKTVVVNFSGSPVTMTPFIHSVAGILQAWFPGQECGHSVARVLTGHVNPSGRLPLSWPNKVNDNASFGNFPVDEHDMLHYAEGLNVGYRHYDRETSPDPLFPFGFGLSYTTFRVSEATAAASAMSSGVQGTMAISCAVTNTGARAGKLVVQFYVQSPAASRGQARPLKELKAFVKVALDAGQRDTVTVELDKYSVSYYDEVDACWRAEQGIYRVLIGMSVVDIYAEVVFEVPEEFTWIGV